MKCIATGILGTVAVIAVFGLAGCPKPEKAAPVVSIAPWTVDFANHTTSATVKIISAGPDAAGMSFSAQSEEPWLNISPTSGVLYDDGLPVEITLSITRAVMKPGGNRGAVSILINGSEQHVVTVRADATLAADFVASPTVILENQPVSFSDTSNVLTGAAPIIRWHWDFGDGTTSSERNPVHDYASRGRYTVRLHVESADLSDVRTRAGYIHVRAPQGPTADFVAATTQPIVGIPVQFSSISSPGTTPISSWLWDFGDGTRSVLQNPVHIYVAASVYDVYLTVATRIGSDSNIKLGYISVQPAPPVAEFSTPHRVPFVGEPLEFNELSIPNGRPITGWHWDFGDGARSYEPNPVHIYTAVDLYSVSLTVESPAGKDLEHKGDYVIVQPMPGQVPFRLLTPE
jgi:PKD repeat protein